MESADLRLYRSQGFFVGPGEDERQFLQRIAGVGTIDFDGLFPGWKRFPLKIEGTAKQRIQSTTRSHFAFSIDWLPGFICNHKLPFWLGGATWVIKEGSSVYPVLQLRKSFLHKKRCGFVSFNDVITHEMVHAARAAFNEPIFEEFFAYQIASKSLYRRFGPLFQKPFESSLFVMTLVGGFFWGQFSIWGMLLPCTTLAYLLGRLYAHQRMMKRCLRKLDDLLDTHSLAFALHLTDCEIKLFARFSKEKIWEYINRQNTLRWQQIKASFDCFSPKADM